MRAIKLAIDRDRRPGCFLLTGSSHVLTLSRVSESLAGRIAVHELEPLAWTELAKRPPANIIDALLAANNAEAVVTALGQQAVPNRSAEMRELIIVGGFPTRPRPRSARARNLVPELSTNLSRARSARRGGDRQSAEFFRLLTLLALRSAQMLNFSDVSRDLGLPVTTLRRYFQALQQTYQATLLPPFTTNLEKRLVKAPKVYLRDTGMACHLAGADDWDRLEHQGRVGAMVETWAYGELRKQLSRSAASTLVSYWRTHGGYEVDFMIERGDRVVGIEVKWSSSFTRDDLRGLREAQACLGKRWHLGVLLHSGTQTLALDERTVVIPFSVFFGRDRARARAKDGAHRRRRRG